MAQWRRPSLANHQGLAIGSLKFRTLERGGFVSLAGHAATLYLDNITLDLEKN